MPRHCLCDKPECPLCWLYHNDPRYRKLWDTPVDPQFAPPTLLQKAGNLALAVVRHAADGLAEVPDEQYAARLAVCDSCEFRKPDWTCSHPACGCFLTVKAKWRSEHCPLRKWPGDGQPEAARTGGKCGGCDKAAKRG